MSGRSSGAEPAVASGATLGARGECREHLGEVAADVGADLRSDGLGGRSGDLHPVGDARAAVADGLDPVRRADHEVAAVGLVDEQFGLDGFGDTQLDRLVARRRHQNRAARGERTAKLDPLDPRVPLWPALDVRPELPNGLGPRARLDAVLDGPHQTHSNPDVAFPTRPQGGSSNGLLWRTNASGPRNRQVKSG